MTTATPRADFEPSNQPMLSAQSDPVELYQQLCKVTVYFNQALDACVEYREQLDESKADLMRTQIEMQLEIDKAEAGVGRLKALLQEARPVFSPADAINCIKAIHCRMAQNLGERIDEALNPETK